MMGNHTMSPSPSPQTPDPSADLNDLISLSMASELSGLSASHLRLLVARGDLWGTKIGRNWLTSRQAVAAYLEIDHKPGPKPKSTN